MTKTELEQAIERAMTITGVTNEESAAQAKKKMVADLSLAIDQYVSSKISEAVNLIASGALMAPTSDGPAKLVAGPGLQTIISK